MKKSPTAPVYSPLWKKLYSLLQKFVKTEPWVLFENEDVFLVQIPRNNHMYLCCVMGNGGDEFGLNAYRGAEGIRSFFKMITKCKNGTLDSEFMYELDMLSFSLSPRDFMEKQDFAVTKNLKLSFSEGKWPLVRRYQPHFFPWFLSEPEIEDLCDCLEQALLLYDKGVSALTLIRNVKPGEILVRLKENGSWVSHHKEIPPPMKKDTPKIQLDDITAQRLRNLPATGFTEEIDLIHLPGAITDNEPHYFGLVLLGINEEELANQYGLFTPFEDYFQHSCESLVQVFLSRGSKPRKVFLKDDSPFADQIETVAQQSDIRFERVDKLPMICEFLDSIDKKMYEDHLIDKMKM